MHLFHLTIAAQAARQSPTCFCWMCGTGSDDNGIGSISNCCNFFRGWFDHFSGRSININETEGGLWFGNFNARQREVKGNSPKQSLTCHQHRFTPSHCHEYFRTYEAHRPAAGYNRRHINFTREMRLYPKRAAVRRLLFYFQQHLKCRCFHTSIVHPNKIRPYRLRR